jgi:hypothetical protein
VIIIGYHNIEELDNNNESNIMNTDASKKYRPSVLSTNEKILTSILKDTSYYMNSVFGAHLVLLLKNFMIVVMMMTKMVTILTIQILFLDVTCMIMKR